MTPDSHPIIGAPEGIAGLTVVTGFSGHGFKLAPAVGRGVAEWILEGEPRAFPASFFSPERFGEGRTIESGYEYGIIG
jgi:sarcosine oxidase subunit beta